MNIANIFTPRRRITAILILLGAALTGCATVKSGAHHDEQASFDEYQSFAWIADNPMILGDGDQPPISPLAQKIIVQSIEDELTGKGFNYLEAPEDADFVVAYTVGTREKIVATSYPTAYGGTWGSHLHGQYYYQSGIEHRTYTEGTLGIDIFDGKTKQPVWHGWAGKSVTSTDRNNPSPAIQSAVAAIIKQFPPSN